MGQLCWLCFAMISTVGRNQSCVYCCNLWWHFRWWHFRWWHFRRLIVMLLQIRFCFQKWSHSVQLLIAISTVVSSLFSLKISIAISKLATVGSDAAVILSIVVLVNSSRREVSNPGLRFGFGAADLEFWLCYRWNWTIWSQFWRCFWKNRLVKY